MVKRCHALTTILNQEPTDVGILIADNIKCMDGTPQRACRHFCVNNELCGLTGVPTHPDDVMISHMVPIRKSTMRRIPI